MAKTTLKLLKPKLTTLPARLATPRQERERKRLREREQSTEYRKWYKTRRWQLLRQQVLQRDRWTCQQTGIILSGKYGEPNSPVVDHVRAHGGNSELFWSIDNLQAVAKSWHDSEKQSRERAEQKAASETRGGGSTTIR